MKLTKKNVEQINSKLNLFFKFIEEYNFLNGIFDYISENKEDTKNIETKHDELFTIPKGLFGEIEKAIEDVNDGNYSERVKDMVKLYDDNIDIIIKFKDEYKMATDEILKVHKTK